MNSYPTQDAAPGALADENRESVLEFVRQHLKAEVALYDARPEASNRIEPLVQRWGREDSNSEAERFAVLRDISGSDLSNLKILDMAAGCGNFMLQGSLQGLDVTGIEPEGWKLDLIQQKIKVYGLNPSWSTRIVDGVGEKMPFADASFDIVDSWQTLEHVQDLDKCLSEIYRVLKPGGFAVLHAPNYFSFYEGHYKIFWLPMMHGALGERYLRWRKRPTAGLRTFWPITKTRLKRSAQRAGFATFNLKRLIYQKHLRKRLGWKAGLPASLATGAVFFIKRILFNARYFYRIERDFQILIIKPPLDSSAAGRYVKK